MEGRPRELLKTAQLDLRKSLTSVVGRVRDDDCPIYQYINWRLEPLEECELWAERLDGVTSYRIELRSGYEVFTRDFTRTGGRKLKRQRLRGTMSEPGDTEAVRVKYRPMANHRSVTRPLHPGHKALRDQPDSTWTKHIAQLLRQLGRTKC